MINQPRQRAGVRAIVGNAFIAALAVFAAGCDLSTGEATVNSINQFVQVRNPIGHVQGIVTDSNGRPLQNALVTTGSRQTTTNSGGFYEFRDLEVVNAVGGDAGTAHPALKIVISPTASTFTPALESSPPSGNTSIRHLGAIVTVTPNAQINDSVNAPVGDSVDGDGNLTVFVDGFRVQAADAVLPELNATIEVLALRDEDTGQALPSGTTVTLDFQAVGGTGEEPPGIATRYPTVSWSTTVQADGSVTFTSVAANSEFEMHVRGYSCFSQTDNAVTALGTCSVESENETNVATYENFTFDLLADSGDTIEPFPISVAGNYTTDMAMLDTACADDVGLLSRAINGTTNPIRITFNEGLSGSSATASSLAVYDTTNDVYLAVASVAVASDTVTVTTSSALPAGIEFSVYLFRPDFADAAGNVITANVTPSDFADINCEDVAGNWVGYLAIDLHTFSQPNTNVAAVTPMQEEIDPVDSGADNDLPVNQAQSVAYNDVDDDAAGIQQLNADNTEFKLEGLELRADAFGAISGVAEVGTGAIDVRTARVEFTPATGASGYRISRNGDADVEVIEPEEFDDNDDVGGFVDADADVEDGAGAASCTDGIDNGPDGLIDAADPDCSGVDGSVLRIQNVDRGAGTLYALVLSGSEEGDIVCVEALDDLGNAGTAGCETVLDNVEPTVTIQRSYHADFSGFPGLLGDVNDGTGPTSIESDSDGDNVSSCFSHNNGHAGIALASGTTRFGEGGELTDPGAAQAVGNLCIGSSPELLVDADGDSDSAHPELEAPRNTAFDTTTAATTYAARAYDGAAFTAWARPTPIKMGAAFTEDLLTTVTPVETGVSAALSGFLVQNNTLAGHLSAPVIEDLVSFDVDDVYDLANADHGGTINFTGVADLAGNTASAAANAVLTVRDQWPPYLVATTQRNADGTITFVFDTAVTIQDGDVITLDDANVAPVSIDFTRDVSGDPDNFTQSVDGKTVTRSTDGLPEIVGYPGLFVDADLTYADPGAGVQHVIADFSEIFDTRGNRWDQHPAIDAPVFIMPDALAPYTVGPVTEDAPVPAGSATVTLTIPTNHATYNWFASALSDVTPATGAVVFPSTSCVNAPADASVSCPAMPTGPTLTYTAVAPAPPTPCTLPATYSLSLNAAHTLITATFTCAAGIVDTGDTLTFTYLTPPVSDFDGTTDPTADTAVTAN